LFDVFEYRSRFPHVDDGKLTNWIRNLRHENITPQQWHFVSALREELEEWCAVPPVFPEGGARGAKVMRSIIEQTLQASHYGDRTAFVTESALEVFPDRVVLPAEPGGCDPLQHLPAERCAELLEQSRTVNLEDWNPVPKACHQNHTRERNHFDPSDGEGEYGADGFRTRYSSCTLPVSTSTLQSPTPSQTTRL
jgi:hypothetical protein